MCDQKPPFWWNWWCAQWIIDAIYCVQITATIVLMLFTFGWWTLFPPPAIRQTRKEIQETHGE